MQADIVVNGRHRHYDTEAADLIGHRSEGQYGDPRGFEEFHYVMPNRQHFVYGLGGPESPYPEPAIRPVTPDHVLG